MRSKKKLTESIIINAFSLATRAAVMTYILAVARTIVPTTWLAPKP